MVALDTMKRLVSRKRRSWAAKQRAELGHAAKSTNEQTGTEEPVGTNVGETIFRIFRERDENTLIGPAFYQDAGTVVVHLVPGWSGVERFDFMPQT